MPELPEMENYMKLLIPKIVNKVITKVDVNREKSINIPVNKFIHEVSGSTIIVIERRAKHLLFYLDNGKILLLHLMLGGWMFYGSEEQKPKRTIQVQIHFGEESLYFIGLRLGYLHLLTKQDIEERLGELGPEPLHPSFTIQLFSEMMSPKRGVLKTTLVDQHFISGIGNCYSDEICFDAEILPMRKVVELEEDQLNKLYQSIQKVLTEAIQYGGYMESPLYVGDQLTGKFNDRCKVYDRGGEPCLRCGSPIVKDELSSRKVFYCRNCQH